MDDPKTRVNLEASDVSDTLNDHSDLISIVSLPSFPVPSPKNVIEEFSLNFEHERAIIDNTAIQYWSDGDLSLKNEMEPSNGTGENSRHDIDVTLTLEMQQQDRGWSSRAFQGNTTTVERGEIIQTSHVTNNAIEPLSRGKSLPSESPDQFRHTVPIGLSSIISRDPQDTEEFRNLVICSNEMVSECNNLGSTTPAVYQLTISPNGTVENDRFSKFDAFDKEKFTRADRKKWKAEPYFDIKRLDGNKLLVVGNNQIIPINYLNYVNEKDVHLKIDEDWTHGSRALPLPTGNCQAPSCRLGCICESINMGSHLRSRCDLPGCMFHCSCHIASYDSENIRTRLRPRVCLLNWRTIKSSDEHVRSPGSCTNSSGTKTARGLHVKSQKSTRNTRNNLFEMGVSSRTRAASKHHGVAKIKSHAIACLRKKTKPTSTPLPDLKNCRIPIRRLKIKATQKLTALEPDTVSEAIDLHLSVPSVIETIISDGQLFLTDSNPDFSCFFFAWSLESRSPKVVNYTQSVGDARIPWLYLPIPEFREVWIIHRIVNNLNKSAYVFIPELKVMILSRTLNFYFQRAQTMMKGLDLKILWKGQDSKKRNGSLFIFPELPGVLLLGPFPRDQLELLQDYRPSKKSSDLKIEMALNACSLIERKSEMRSLGDAKSWDIFYSTNYDNFVNILNQPDILMSKEDDGNGTSNDDDDDVIPEELFMKMIPGFINPSS